MTREEHIARALDCAQSAHDLAAHGLSLLSQLVCNVVPRDRSLDKRERRRRVFDLSLQLLELFPQLLEVHRELLGHLLNAKP